MLLEQLCGRCTAKCVCCWVAQRLMCYGVLPCCRVQTGRACSSVALLYCCAEGLCFASWVFVNLRGQVPRS